MKKSKILDAFDWMIETDKRLPASWPEELPPESDPGFWTEAMKAEMTGRVSLSKKIRLLIADPAQPHPMTDLESWLYRRRAQWARQCLHAAAQKGLAIPDEAPLGEVLYWVLVQAWEKEGCLAFWEHAIERGGVPHPDNPEGFSPLG